MSISRDFLDNLIQSGKDLLNSGRQLAEKGLNIPESGPEREKSLSNLGKGAMAGGVLALLLGTRGGRRLGKSALKLGALAAVGTLGYKAYQNWQHRNTSGFSMPDKSASTAVADQVENHFTHELTGEAANQRCQLLLRAMIGAAKADGHVDKQELQRIRQQLDELNVGNDTKALLESELYRPVNVDELAQGADTLAAKIETYLASAYVIDVDNPDERDYLDRLANALKLDHALARSIETELNG
ncbi:MAG TPA: tellurite resistance TerB family protein [Pirellulaceae bacterium]|nr:tellurite resistance TerB family protein [Pirellulaceae bacterium]HMO92938.1 tellurite resistance TerB family protein [Pirellulaceae bacterium]HMP68497.1 tellurite resistance TerB family protein [Pirellulaceae bacterium]